MTTLEKDRYFVAVKVLLRDSDNLLITKDIFDDDWDLPGGRIKRNEFDTPLAEIVERKMNEELGEHIQYQLGEPVVFFRHEREEHSTGEVVRIFAIGYEAAFLEGEIQLGKHHEKYKWVDINTFTPESYFRGGWLSGVTEYLENSRR